MIRIACLLNKKNGVIAQTFEEAAHAVFIDAETGSILKEMPRMGMTDEEFAEALGEEKVEAVITGAIEKAPFNILAEKYWITRYDGVGLRISEAVRLMNEYRLRMITDHIGGTGHHDHGHDHDHEHEHDN